MAEPPTLDLSFLSTDVKNQIATSQTVLDQVKVLPGTLPEITNNDARQAVEGAIKVLLGAVGTLTANASVVATTGTVKLAPLPVVKKST